MIFKFYLNFEYNTDIEQRGKKMKVSLSNPNDELMKIKKNRRQNNNKIICKFIMYLFIDSTDH